MLHGSTGGGEGLAHLLHSIPLAAPLGLGGLEAPQEARDPRGPLARLQPCVSGHLVGYHDVKLSGLASILDCGVGLQAFQAAPSRDVGMACQQASGKQPGSECMAGWRRQELPPTLQRTLVPLSSVRCMYLHAVPHTQWGRGPGMQEEQLAPELQPHPRYSCACRPSSCAAVRPAAGWLLPVL